MNANKTKQAVTAVIAVLVILAAGLIVWKEMYAFSPDRQWDQARAARAAGHRSPPDAPPTPAKAAPTGATAHKPGVAAAGGKPTSSEKSHEK